MLGTKTATIARLKTTNQKLQDRLQNAIKAQRTAISVSARLARRADNAWRTAGHLQARLHRALRACARYRNDLTTAQHRIEALERQLDESRPAA